MAERKKLSFTDMGIFTPYTETVQRLRRQTAGERLSRWAYSGIVRQATKLAVVLPVVSIGAFFVSIGINAAIFYNWGLTFSQIASSGDVVMSGLNACFTVMLAIVGGFVGRYAAMTYQERVFDMGSLLIDLTLSSKLGAAIFETVMLIVCMAAVFGAVFYLYRNYALAHPLSVVTACAALVLVSDLMFLLIIYMMAVLHHFFKRAIDKYQTIPSFVRAKAANFRITPYPILTLLVLIYAAWSIAEISETGYFPKGVTLIVPLDGCASAQIMWIGEHAAVARCASKKYRTITDRDKLVLESSTPDSRIFSTTGAGLH